ncbi:MAG: type II toxin-antitoxin system RelE/ParE family toxin [Synergistaceae bacterium]|nr:type II toxin-antitoxin system RelE/ParE family toxin [Synergistaceae bacterium]
MKYRVDYDKKADKQLRKMDLSVSSRIYDWIGKNLEGCEDPRAYGKALKGTWEGYWRYRVGDYRIIADIQDDKILILVTEVGHRREVYE